MKLGRRSTNISDRRGMGPAMAGGGGAIILVILGLIFGVDPRALLQQGGAPTGTEQQQGAPGTPADEAGSRVAGMLASTEDVWKAIFAQSGRTYPEPTLVLFTGATQSSCGYAAAAVGPFYCPGDQQVYVDLDFFDELSRRFGAPGDFAQAYVIAHEVGHHVQHVLGLLDRAGGAGSSSTSVRQELQADCLAGVWAYHAGKANQLEPGDVEEALNAASAIGDDRLQQETQGRVVPDAFTHGTSAQRVRWFKQGMETGRIDACDTSGAL